MKDDQFTKLFVYMTKRFDELEEKLAAKADGERVYAALDALNKRLDTFDVEREATNTQLSRHDNWISRASKPLNLSYWQED